MLLAGISTGHKIGLGLVGLAFISFALASSFLLPRLRPGFPGKAGVSGFVAVTVLFFCAMISAVWFFGKEPKEAKAGETAPPVSTTAPAGDPAAGKALFAANGCSSCHTFKPAGATGKVGPDLDNLAADAKKANRGSLEQYVTESIKDPNAYVVPGFPKGVMPPFASLGDRKIADLVAFLTRRP